ncbi:MAG: F0F1 ATP synthase subunit gamma [Prevotella sp.]|jgi:F-type H+-transporting ATPase subunit gamma|nr:F0F1 ATP synthase subunit gamma [Prevotella sp.]MBP6528356.1 F0F1 ATP synthase subunit gamma [Prevotella sp.]MBP7097657.1 F0F1 ATP synthase subunit gamma [Prevotella sp.]MBP8686601.1 F0F1 ATP synthase subunit gamma [Prevotella sp.]MBP8934447.1 F0F1 ATP synthase subunit gamma [Prevotella sp.]MBP9982668.1 F0F1 ATP synthase subunit gamma [Prevotella sp.]
MPSLKEIKTRIDSVNSTRKITSAMKMVASSKLHHAQTAIQSMLPYENLLEHILKSFLLTVPEVLNELESQHQVKKVAFVVYTSNSSLCGGFNNNVIKMLGSAIDDYKAQGINDIIVYPIGRKVEEYVVKQGLTKAGSYLELVDKPNSAGCAAIAKELRDKFLAHEIDKVEIIYHHFKSAGSQILTRKTYLPIDLSTESIGNENDRDLSSNTITAKSQEYLKKRKLGEEGEKAEVKPLNDNFIVEPDLNTVLRTLIPKQLNLQLYTALLDSNASEHAARMVAMQTATDNANELLSGLNLQYNKSRQQAITNELLDIVGGSSNR